MTRVRFIRTLLTLIALLFPILSVSMANEVINFQCNGMDPENGFLVSIHYSNDHYNLAELNDHIDCKIPNVSLSGNYCIIQNNHDGYFSWVTPYVVRNNKLVTGISFDWESFPTYDSAVSIHLMNESFLI